MKRGWIILVLFVVLLGGCGVTTYNRLVTQQTGVRQAFAQVDSDLLRRNDLIPNLVETVKGFAAQERAVFGAIAQARSQMAGARTPAERIAAGSAMDTALGRLLVVVENYPQLRSSENFMRLQDEIAGTENRLNVSRRRYNDVVTQYNVMVKRFPTNLFARTFGFAEEPFYPVSAAQREVPRVQFNPAPGESAR